MLTYRFEKRIEINGYTVDIFILDTAGQEEYIPLRNTWIKDRDAFIIALDITNPDLSILEKFHDCIKTYHSEPESVPIALVFTKIDLGYKNEDLLKMETYAKENGWQINKTSSKTNTNVEKAFEELTTSALKIKYNVLEYSDIQDYSDIQG